MPSVSDYTSTVSSSGYGTGVTGLERSVGVYGSRTSLLGQGGVDPQPPASSSRYLQSSASSSNILALSGMGSVMDSRQNFPLQRIATADKIGTGNGMSRAQKTLSMHGMPSIPTTQPPPVQNRSSIGGGGAGAAGNGGSSKWWCAPFGADGGAGCDYLGAGARPVEQDYLSSSSHRLGGHGGHMSTLGGHQSYRSTAKVCPIQDDEDGHLSYKLGDIIENENFRCKRKS